MSQQRQRFNETFKRETVKYVQEQTKSLGQIAEELNIHPDNLRQWVAEYREFEHENEPVNYGKNLRRQALRKPKNPPSAC